VVFFFFVRILSVSFNILVVGGDAVSRIMVVDGNHEVGQFIFDMISRIETYEVSVNYSNAVEALKSLKLIRPNMIFINVLLNGMTGIKLTNLIKQKYPDIFIILMSDNSSYALDGFEAGADSFLSKPIKEEDLISLLKKAKVK